MSTKHRYVVLLAVGSVVVYYWAYARVGLTISIVTDTYSNNITEHAAFSDCTTDGNTTDINTAEYAAFPNNNNVTSYISDNTTEYATFPNNTDDNATDINTTNHGTTDTNYSWVGKRWDPPPNVPYLSPQDLRRVFRSESTLWWGDLTVRQDYHTMYALMVAKDARNIHTPEVIQNINKGNSHPDKIKFYCPNRTAVDTRLFDLGQVEGTPCSSNTTSSIGKFDLAYDAHKNHFDYFLPFDNATISFLRREYGVVVLSLGIHDTIFPSPSSHPALVQLLNALRLASGPSLYVVWKTHGPDAREVRFPEWGERSDALRRMAQEWFRTRDPEHMGLSDFGAAIAGGERAFGLERINGDLEPHWGPEARTLSIQMVGHLVYERQRSGYNIRGR